MSSELLKKLVTQRLENPQIIAELAAQRTPATSLLGSHGRLMVIAADHPARGALRAGDNALAMGDRSDLLERLTTALSNPGVNGVLGTPDIIEDLLLMGALEGKVVIGSMNRGGLTGTSFEMDDRFTAYDAQSIARFGFNGGKMLMRIDPDDNLTVSTLEACASAVSELAGRELMAMIEPFISHRVDGRIKNELTQEAMTRAISVASGLGNTSAFSWLKVPIVDNMEQVMFSSSLPAVILGGEVSSDPDKAYADWRSALRIPTVRGLVIGRSLLYPPDGDVKGAVDTVVGLL